MAPADEGFRADQAAIRETDLRLVEQFEFIPLDGMRQFGLQRQARFKFLPDGAFEHHMPATPRRLGTAKCKMAVAQQFIGGTAIAGIDGSADAGATTLDQFKLGETIANDPVTMESLKGKVVVIELWGIH